MGVPLSSTPPTPPIPVSGSLTGNWQIAAATTSGTPPFSALTGSIVAETAAASTATTLVSVVQAVNPSSCYFGQTTVPSEGSLTGSSFTLTSFSVDGQYLTLNGTPSATNNSFTGSFSISGGCADGTKGTVSGTQIAPMTGTYTGALSATPVTLGLTLTQDAAADGLGYFHVNGSASFVGISCFTSGTLENALSTISGEGVVLTLATNESPSSTVVATGSLSPDASTLTLSSVQVASGGCVGNGGGGTLTR